MSMRSQSGALSLAQPLMGNELESIIRSLNDSSQRDDLKLKAVQEIWANYEVFFSSPTYQNLLENVIRAFLKLFTETVPQFIAENNTQHLRKQMLEIILRTSNHDVIKQFSKDLMKQMLRIVMVENEENSILAIKIIIDHAKYSRAQLSTEVGTSFATCMQQLKVMMKDMQANVALAAMFENKEIQKPANISEDSLIDLYLQNCYFVQSVTLTSSVGPSEGKVSKFNLLPRAKNSLKVMQELPQLVMSIYQWHKHTLQSEIIEFMLACAHFVTLTIPQHIRETEKGEPNGLFNRGLGDEFYLAQTKCISHLVIMCKVPAFMDAFTPQVKQVVNGALTLLEDCPHDLTTVRKDVFIALKFFFSSEVRSKFAELLPKVISERIMIGKGFTSNDFLRNFMYTMLADILHHMRTHINFPMMTHIVHTFCRQVHDNTMGYQGIQVQVMSIRVLTSVVDVMGKLENTTGEAVRDLLLEMMESLVTKMKIVSVYHIPQMMKIYGSDSTYEYSRAMDKDDESHMRKDETRYPTADNRRWSVDSMPEFEQQQPSTSQAQVPPPLPPFTKESRMSTPETILGGLYTTMASPMSLSEARSLVKYLVLGCKYATVAMFKMRRSTSSETYLREKNIYERLLKYGLLVLDVFIMNYQPNSRGTPAATQRSKEEKETIESFANTFIGMDMEIFKEIFSKYIDFLVERVARNLPLQLIVNTFLVRTDVSGRFGSILLKYLMEKMPCLAIYDSRVAHERTGLYVKLFKIIFSAIGCSQPTAPEGELMLKPYLPNLIRKSTEYSLKAKEPLNYFLLLRALFRSIGGGAHDLLYGQFLPLLPNLLQYLNKLQVLQSCQHRQYMRELFVELCLTVPVRLSSLLPYLPLLMDPLVCALHGSTTLVQQGLRTLELCVDNLQPEYLFEHMTPVRANLMQGLWKVVGSSPDSNSAGIAFRILGKFGGANRRMLCEPQLLTSKKDDETQQSCAIIEFDRPIVGIGYYGDMQMGPMTADLSLSEMMKTAAHQMQIIAHGESNITSLGTSFLPMFNQTAMPANAPQIRHFSLELSRGLLLSAFGSTAPADVWSNGFVKNIKDLMKNLQDPIPFVEVYKCKREHDRQVFINAIQIYFYGLVNKLARPNYVEFFSGIVKQCTLQALIELSGREYLFTNHELDFCMDSSVLVDAMIKILSEPNKEYSYPVNLCLTNIRNVVVIAIPEHEKLCYLPFLRYLMAKLEELCYGPSWYARLGGVTGFDMVIEIFPVAFIVANLAKIAGSLMEVVHGLIEETSSGASDLAIQTLKKLQRVSLSDMSLTDEEKHCRLTAFMSVYSTKVFHGSKEIRDMMFEHMSECADLTNLTLGKLLQTHAEMFFDDIERIFDELVVLSMREQSASLDTMSILLSSEPPMTEWLISSNSNTQKFLGLVTDIVSTDLPILMTREPYKSSDNCPAHFLPPYPVSHQVDELKAHATKTVVACYRVLVRRSASTQPKEEPMETEENEIILTAGDLLVVALQAMLKGSETVQKAAFESLFKLSQTETLPPDVVRQVANEVFSRVEEDTCLTSDFGHLFRFSSLNTTVFTVSHANKLVDHVCSWQPLDSNGMPPPRSVDEVEAVGYLLKLLYILKECEPALALKVADYVAYFESIYALDYNPGWHPLVCRLLSRWPVDTLNHYLSVTSIQLTERRALLRWMMKLPEAEPMVKILIEKPEYFDNLLEFKALSDGEWTEVQHSTDIGMMDREMQGLWLIDLVSRKEQEWFAKASTLILKLREIWNSVEFKQRYAVRMASDDEAKRITILHITHHKYKVPKMIVNCFLRYLRNNYEDIDLMFDLQLVFIGIYCTDFSYVREFLEKEVIPIYPMKWRAKALEKVVSLFETDSERYGKDMRLVKIIQYIITPCLHWAFERYDVDVIIGPPLSPSDNADDDDTSLVHRLAMVITQLEDKRYVWSDGMIIVVYQLCTLLVQFAPAHIHNNARKKQGPRLRIFMLFAWPCLTTTNHQDPTMRCTGLVFLANIIEKFTINRKIVLQVFHCLCTSYTPDNRELIKKAVDVLTPAVPIRMEDGHQQILSNVKRIFLEEGHSAINITHVLHMVIRNYRVYFDVRHELLSPMLSALGRVVSHSANVGDMLLTRRLALDACEVIIKWELLRIEYSKNADAKSESTCNRVENLLECLKTDREIVDAPTPNQQNNSTNRVDSQGYNSSSFGANGKEDHIMKPIAKEHVDHVVNMLLRFASQTPPSANQPHNVIVSSNDMVKRSLSLLKAAMKAGQWGEVATIKSSWLEKSLTISAELVNARQDASQSQVVMHQFLQAQTTLEIVLNLISIMPKPLLLQTIKPLQRSIISCLNSNSSALVRTVTSLIGRLFEKTKTSPTGLDEMEILNQYISKYINDQFNAYVKSPSNQAQMVYPAFCILRTACNNQPGYLDAMCLQAFIKVIEKIVRDNVTNAGSMDDRNGRERGFGEILIVALELVRPRVTVISTENKRTICQNILLPLIEKLSNDKIMEGVLKLVNELVITHNDDGYMNPVNPGLPLVARMMPVIERRYRHSKDMVSMYLSLILYVYEHPALSKSDFAEKLEDAFYWGLSSHDPELREKFLRVFEKDMATNVISRLTFILKQHDWLPLKDYFWLKHAVWLVLRCIPKSTPLHKRILFRECATFGKTMTSSGGLMKISMNGLALGDQVEANTVTKEEPMDTDEYEPKPDITDPQRLLDEMLDGQRRFLEDAANFDVGSLVDSVHGLVFAVQDTEFIAAIWTRLFCSLWSTMTDSERDEIGALLQPFMSSGVHIPQADAHHSVLSVWLDTLSKAKFNLEPALTKYISSRHHCWHRGILMLEAEAMYIPRMQNHPMLLDTPIDPQMQHQLDVLEHLGNLYSELSELDQFAAVWDRKALTSDTGKLMAYMQMGDFEEASEFVEILVGNLSDKLSAQGEPGRIGPVIANEYEHWSEMYKKCLMELGRWQNLRDYANSHLNQDLKFLMAAAPHIPDWLLLSDCRDQMYGCIPPSFLPQFTIYNFMLNVMHHDADDQMSHKSRMDNAFDEAVKVHIAKWRTLPKIVANSHIQVLQAMNMVREIADCQEMKLAIDSNGPNYNTVLTEMKSVIKIWRSRSSAVSDDMSFVTATYEWRAQMHALIVRKFDEWERSNVQVPQGANAQSILPIHSAAQGQVAICKSSRNAGLFNMALLPLQKIHSMLSIPMMDAHSKVYEHVKLLKAMADKSDRSKAKEALFEALELIEITKPDDFNRDQVCRLMYQKGTILSKLSMKEEAMKTFSAAAQLFDPAYQSNTWGVFKAWGHHMDKLFHDDKNEVTGSQYGIGALHCYLEASRIEIESKARKYIARVLWTVKHIAAACTPVTVGKMDAILRKHSQNMQPFNWVSWLPQLVTEVRHRPKSGMVQIIEKIGVTYPMQVFYAIRLELDQDQTLMDSYIAHFCLGTALPAEETNTWKVVLIQIIGELCKARPTDIRNFNRFLRELDSQREYWVERHARYAINLKEELFRCLFASREEGLEKAKPDASVLTAIQLWRQELIEPSDGILREADVNPISYERRPQLGENEAYIGEDEFIAALKAEILQCLAHQWENGHLLEFPIMVLKWIKKLLDRLNNLAKRIPMAACSKYLANFSHRIACIEMPSDLLNVLKAGQYASLISRVDAHVEVLPHGGKILRKMTFRAQTGKTAIFYLKRNIDNLPVNRCNQWLGNVNAMLLKEKETCRRHLSIFTPTQLKVGAKATIVEILAFSGASLFPYTSVEETRLTTNEVIHPLDILGSAMNAFTMRHDDVITMFFERILGLMYTMTSGIPGSSYTQACQEAFKNMMTLDFLKKTMLQDFLLQRYTDPTMYYMLRKTIAHHLGVLGVLELTSNLSPLNLDRIHISSSTGQIFNCDYRFEDRVGLGLEAYVVPFRLSPNFDHFLGMAVDGDLLWAAAATARCLNSRQPHIILRPCIFDEVAAKEEGKHAGKMCLAADSIVNKITLNMKKLASTDNTSRRDDVISHITRSRQWDSLAKMDPRWHPWF